jgi:hypothetical protein
VNRLGEFGVHLFYFSIFTSPFGLPHPQSRMRRMGGGNAQSDSTCLAQARRIAPA